ncbi:MAG: hypothetical protein QOI78_2924 [Actinomycetota bacterium]|jgi:uncharacterized protein YlxW (UPF0749 family)|nr:hypothetical protein [Actinomycetota bacterium]
MSRPPARTGTWARVLAALVARPSRAQAAVATLCGLLAFGLVTQVHATSASGGLVAARPDDLLGILSDLNNRADRLRADISDLENTELTLRSGTGRDAAALRAARARARTLGILTGSLAARGPGIVLTVDDPGGRVRADVLVDALQELRDAGAEAMQLADVRVVASTAVIDDPGGGVEVDGVRITAPYRLAAIGDQRTLAGALGIPGGVLDTIDRQGGARAHVVASPGVTITALRALREPRYARPAHD